jgi:hypothetical protein
MVMGYCLPSSFKKPENTARFNRRPLFMAFGVRYLVLNVAAGFSLRSVILCPIK